MDKLSLFSNEIDRIFDRSRAPKCLKDAMRYSLDAGGKRLRPLMMMESCELNMGTAEDVLSLACAIEMIHTYSLIHDDLPCMDNDDYRRGRLTNHKVFGEGMAVLAGDGLLSLAFETMAGSAIGRNENYLMAVNEIAVGAGTVGMVAGQAEDLRNENNPDAGESELVYIHEHKTAAMLIASVTAGAYAAGADETHVSAMREFGRQYGLLFQITDDMLDVIGTFENMGKTIGKDKQAMKLTYPNLYGMERTKDMALETSKRAKEALSCYGERAAYFIELTDKTLNRKK